MKKLEIIGENATIDGVRELLSNKESIRLRSCWIIVWISCNIFMGYVLWAVIMEYSDNPTVTVVESRIPDAFPALTVCPITWMNVTKAEKIGFDQVSGYCTSIHLSIPLEL